VSAIPVMAKTLSDMRLLHRNLGQPGPWSP